MKKVLAMLILMSICMIFPACSSSESEESVAESPAPTSQEMNEENQEDIKEETSEEVKEETDEKIDSTEEIDYITEVENRLNSSQTISFLENIPVDLTDENKKDILSIFNLENKEVVKEDNSFGISGIYFKIGDQFSLVATINENSEYFIIVDETHRIYLTQEETEQFVELALNLTNESIKNTNKYLEEAVYRLVGDMHLNELGTLYMPTDEEILPLTDEEISEVKDLLQLNSWQAYTGEYKNIHEQTLDSTVFLQNKDYYEYEIMKNFLVIAKYGDVYVAKCTFYEGLGGSDYFTIPKEVYDNIMAFKFDKLNEEN